MRKVTDAELADLFNKSVTGDLEEFFANITKSCKDPQQLKKLFKQTSATQLKQRIFKAIACQNVNEISIKFDEWTGPKDQNILFQLISTLDMADHSWFIDKLPHEWQNGYELWKTLVEATGKTNHENVDFLTKDGAKVQYTEDDPFIKENHRLYRNVVLPDPIIDEVKRIRNGRGELVKIVNTSADCTFTIDNEGDCELTQDY